MIIVIDGLNLLRLKSEGSVVHERLRRTFECFSD